jgi:hypothetical protein
MSLLLALAVALAAPAIPRPPIPTDLIYVLHGTVKTFLAATARSYGRLRLAVDSGNRLTRLFVGRTVNLTVAPWTVVVYGPDGRLVRGERARVRLMGGKEVFIPSTIESVVVAEIVDEGR